MDRISTLRNVEDALAAFEAGEIDLATLEQRVQGILRTYATEFEGETLATYRASGEPEVNGLIVVAESPAQARERVAELVTEGDDSEADVSRPIQVERIDD